MSKRYPKARYELPETVDPERICMSVMVPDDPFHIAAFRGALLTLASARSWANDTEHTALAVAAVWDEIYQEVSDCIMALMDVRQNEETPCVLEKTEDGETWEQWADLQLCPPKIRTSKGKMQWYNGTAWVDLPGGGDERYDGEADPQWTDPPVGETGQCLAAENIVASYVTMLTQTKAGLDAVATISGIVDIVAGYIGTQTLFPPALLILNISIAIGSLAALGSEAIDGLIDSPDVDTLKCIINCHASSDGAFTAEEFNAIQDDVSEQIEEPTRLIMTEFLNSYGPVGLTRAAAANGIEDGDCADCDCDGRWTHTWNSVQLADWRARAGHATTYVSGGWQGGCDDQGLGLDRWHQLVIEIDAVRAGTIDKATVTIDRVYSGFNDAPGASSIAAVNFTEGGGGSAVGTDPDLSTYSGQVVLEGAAQAIASDGYFTIIMPSGYLDSRGNCDSFGSAYELASEVTLEGPGVDPFI